MMMRSHRKLDVPIEVDITPDPISDTGSVRSRVQASVKSKGQKVLRWLRIYFIPALGVVCLVAGLSVGCFLRLTSTEVLMTDTVLQLFSIPGEILNRMLKMLVLPLVISSTVSACARLPTKMAGQMTIRLLLLYLTTSLLAAGAGVLSVLIFQPSAWSELESDSDHEYVEDENYWLTVLLDFIKNLFPENIIQSYFCHSQTVMVHKYKSAFKPYKIKTPQQFQTTIVGSDNFSSFVDYDYNLNYTNFGSENNQNWTIFETVPNLDYYPNPIDKVTEDYLLNVINDTGDAIDFVSKNISEVVKSVVKRSVNTTVDPETGNNYLESYIDYQTTSVQGISLLGVIVFHAIFGLACGQVENNAVERFFSTLQAIIMRISRISMWYFPIGVFFLAFSDVMSTSDIYPFSYEMAMFAAAMTAAMVLHAIGTLSMVYWVLVRRNPVLLWKNHWNPLLVAFGTGSRVVTLPYAMKSIELKGSVDKRMSQFFLPFGAAFNSDGVAIYATVSTLFLVRMTGVELGFEHYLYVCLLAFVLSFTSSSLHTNGVVYIHQLLIVQMSTKQLAVLTSIEWIASRLRAIVNTMSDAIAVSVIQHYYEEELEESNRQLNKKWAKRQRIPTTTYSDESTGTPEDSRSDISSSD